MRELIIGGARSGKSHYAEQLAAESGLEVCYIATGQAGDAEMSARIAQHRARRPAAWQTLESPIALAATLAQAASTKRCLLVDCLTLWLTNLLCAEDAGLFARERDALLEGLPKLPGSILLVSNEVGCGVIPMGELTRRFVDEAGWLNQALARQCERVTLVTAGLPLRLKDTNHA